MMSQRPSFSVAFIVFLMNPRLWPHQMYRSGAPRSSAITAAILFSNPSSFWLENGRFSGSAQTRNSFTSAPKTHVAPMSTASTATMAPIDRMLLRKRERSQNAALIAEAADVSKRAERSQSCGRIVGADVRGDPDPRPPSDSRQYGDILLAVGTNVGHRVADDARRRLEFPQQVARLRIDRLQPAFHRAVEHDVAARR